MSAATVVTVIACCLLPTGTGALLQEEYTQINELGDDTLRIVFPAGAPVSVEDARALADAYHSQLPIPGLPALPLEGSRFTIALASGLPDTADGTASITRLHIALPLSRALSWSASKMHRVIRHEVAHVALGHFMDVEMAPDWFEEGYAEWVSGPPTCKAQARLALVAELIRDGSGGPELVDVGRSTRLSYDLWGTFFAFLDAHREVVSQGELLAAIKDAGVSAGIREVMGTGLDVLEERWWDYLISQYGSITGCEDKEAAP